MLPPKYKVKFVAWRDLRRQLSLLYFKDGIELKPYVFYKLIHMDYI